MYFQHKIDYVISIVTAVFSSIFGKFWFLFAFLLLLNLLDYITGIIKARYLKKENSSVAMKGFCKKVFIWVLVAISFGLSLIFVEVGVILDVNMQFMTMLGWFMLAHAIINEFRSILENIVECDKAYLVPNWLIRSLEVTQKIIDKKTDVVLEELDKIDDSMKDKNL